MASFSLADIQNVKGHAAKGMTWSKGPVIIKRLAFPKGAVPPHLRGYTERFTSVARECARKTAGARGASRVQAMNACISAELGRKR